MEYTQEQIDKIIADAKVDATKGMFTKSELDREIVREADRRVESGIQKGLETAKSKWLDDYTKEQNLSADELAKSKLQEQMDILNKKDADLSQRANLLDAKDKLNGAKVPQSAYENFINSLVVADKETTSANVDNFINMYAGTKAEIETKVKEELSHVSPPPNNVNNTGDVTVEKFKSMTYSEKVAFKASNAEAYAKFIKN